MLVGGGMRKLAGRRGYMSVAGCCLFRAAPGQQQITSASHSSSVKHHNKFPITLLSHCIRRCHSRQIGLQQPLESLCTCHKILSRLPHLGGWALRGCGRWLYTRCSQASNTSGLQSFTTTTASNEPTVVREVLVKWTQSLEAEQVPEAQLASEHIVSHILGVPRSELHLHDTEALSDEQLSEGERLVTCRLARMPLQYILGEWDFHNLTLKLEPPVFIPRPETEQLVELAIRNLREVKAPRVLEIGCGSGAVSLALLHALSHLECVAVDQSKRAVDLAQLNALRLGLRERLTVVEGKVTTDALPSLPHTSYDLIVSNPPYVLRKDLISVQPEIMMYEDLRALDGGKDGLQVIKAILHHASHLLPEGQTLLMEVDTYHPHLLPAWLEKQDLKLQLRQVHKDFCNNERFIEFVKTS